MKKIFFCLSLSIIFASAGMAQSQGSISVGGEFNLWFINPKTVSNSQTVDGTKTTHFTLLPSIEYFVNEEFSIGAGIGYDLTRDKAEGTNSTTINRYGVFYVQPNARKYFKLGDHCDLFGEAGISLGLGSHVNEFSSGSTTVSTKYNYSTYSIGISPGVSFHLSDKLAIESTFGFLGYSGSSTEISGNQTDKTNNFGLQFSTSTLYFGIRYFIK